MITDRREFSGMRKSCYAVESISITNLEGTSHIYMPPYANP